MRIYNPSNDFVIKFFLESRIVSYLEYLYSLVGSHDLAVAVADSLSIPFVEDPIFHSWVVEHCKETWGHLDHWYTMPSHGNCQAPLK